MAETDTSSAGGIGRSATLACLLEVTAPKPGNVHRGADFEDATFADFLASAVAIGPIMEGSRQNGVGPTVLAAVQATAAVTDSNTNLGTVLLLAPLAAVPGDRPLQTGIGEVLRSLRPADASAVYEAIRLASPGGLGQVAELDIAEAPPTDLRSAMRAAAHRDLVARQYTNDFAQVLDEVLPWILAAREETGSLTEAIVHAHIRMMATYPDGLIERKCGPKVAAEAARRAAEVLASGGPGGKAYCRAAGELDFWLRSDHHRRNPGTTADLIAAGLFVGLRENRVAAPFR